MFLLSMMSDLELMNNNQIQKFKHTSLQTVDNILSQNFYVTYFPVSSVNSLVSKQLQLICIKNTTYISRFK